MEPDGIIEASPICALQSINFAFKNQKCRRYVCLNLMIWFCFFPLSFCFSCSLQSTWNQIVDSFDEMSLKEALLRGIYAYGFEKPSAIQQRAIVPCIKGRLGVFYSSAVFRKVTYLWWITTNYFFTLFGAAYSTLPCTNAGYMLDMSPALLISVTSFSSIYNHFIHFTMSCHKTFFKRTMNSWQHTHCLS